MEMCLLLWQPRSHDNCFTGWHRRRHIHKSYWSCINAYKHTPVDMYNPSLSAWLPTFCTRKESCPSFHVCSFSFNFRDCHKIPTSEMTTKHLGLCDVLKSFCLTGSLLRSPSLLFQGLFFWVFLFLVFSFSFPLTFFLYVSSILFFNTANIERDLIDRQRCSISQQISSFVCLWHCLESFSTAASSSTWCFSKTHAWDPPPHPLICIHPHTHTLPPW